MPPKAVSYLRVSTRQQEANDRWGLQRQQEDIARYVDVAELSILEVFKDSITGKSTTREGFDGLKDYCQRHEVKHVIISSIDRLARDTAASYKLMSELIELGLTLHSADYGVIDLDLDESTINFSLRSLVATLEHRAIAKRTRAAHIGMAKTGKPPTGLKAYGYMVVDGKPATVPSESRIVQKIFEWSAEGRALVWIQNELNRQGVPIPQPTQAKSDIKLWHRTVVGKIIRNPIYKGEYRWKTYDIPVPPIVSADLWARAQHIKRGAPRRTDWPLVGHLRCGVCGRRMGARVERRQRTGNVYVRDYYRCSSVSLPTGPCGAPVIDRQPLESEAEAMVRRVFSDRTTLRELLSQNEPPDLRTEEMLRELGEEDKRWLEAYRAGVITPAELGEYRAEIASKKRTLQTPSAPKTYPLEAYAEAAKDMDFRELLDLTGFVVIASDPLRLTVE